MLYLHIIRKFSDRIHITLDASAHVNNMEIDVFPYETGKNSKLFLLPLQIDLVLNMTYSLWITFL